MRLLNTKSLELQEFSEHDQARYAIVSHVWGNEEVTFRDMAHVNSEDDYGVAIRSKKGFDKIRDACKRAAKDGFDHI
jgi:hypothetical protein